MDTRELNFLTKPLEVKHSLWRESNNLRICTWGPAYGARVIITCGRIAVIQKDKLNHTNREYSKNFSPKEDLVCVSELEQFETFWKKTWNMGFNLCFCYNLPVDLLFYWRMEEKQESISDLIDILRRGLSRRWISPWISFFL